jgi:uncharacterized protein YjbI with pentapeptide repeats
MANEEHLGVLRQGVDAWNAWRKQFPSIRPDLRDANLKAQSLGGADLSQADLSRASLVEADLVRADLRGAILEGATLRGAYLTKAKLSFAVLEGADSDLSWAHLDGADISEVHARKANMEEVDLGEANVSNANLRQAKLRGAHLRLATLSGADLSEADLRNANLIGALLVGTRLANADLTGCLVYGVSTWDLKLEGAIQRDLVITPPNEPEITVDNLEVAQFIYLLLNNKKIRDVIDTITSKVVLILGRFTPERKAVLDALREELRKHDYLPILFDFPETESRDLTETISLLARMARFIIADLTSPSSIPKELEAIVSLAVPVQPLIEGSARPFAMFKDYWKYDWVLPVYRYQGLETLLAALAEKVVAPAEVKLKTLEERRRAIEAALITPTPFP